MSGEPTMTQPSEPTRHRMWEDAVAVVTATGMLSLGIVLLSSAQLVTGGTSGLALLISYSSGADFGLKQVIKGWTEGVSLMPVGSKYRFWVPSELAYGSNGTPGGPIGPDATLTFDVELLGVLQ